jgi:hypothetical protein
MSLTSCLKKAGKTLSAENKAAILARAKELQDTGMPREDAGRAAVREVLDAASADLDQMARVPELSLVPMEDGPGMAASRDPLSPPPPAVAMESPDQAMARMQQTVDTMRTEDPDMLVTLPGDEAPIRLGDAMEILARQMDEAKDRSTFTRVAAECAIMSGV